jgi:hypothetical protein
MTRKHIIYGVTVIFLVMLGVGWYCNYSDLWQVTKAGILVLMLAFVISHIIGDHVKTTVKKKKAKKN